MLSSLFKKNITTAYAPLHDPTQSFVRILHDSENHEFDGDVSLVDLLSGTGDESSLVVFQTARSDIFILWTTRCETFTTTTNSRDDALLSFQHFIAKRICQPTQICSLYHPEREGEEKTFMPKHSTRPVLAVLAKYNNNILASLGIPSLERESIAQTCRSRTRTLSKTYLPRPAYIILPAILGAIICLSILSFTHRKTLHTPTDKYHSWTQYSTEGSSGPGFQLAINAHNASEWNTYTKDDTTQWAFRIDDQAIIPAHLMDDEERKYQDWFHKRYPEVSRITKDRDYVNETWLGSPALDRVPVDDLFHFSHCVLALRRYVKAKETGNHVCGRDIDLDHMHHCLDSLDWWAFPDGEMGKDLENPLRPLWWRTKVCFD